ncbi:MAG: hypothetical protein K2K21_09640 [Lachnospiraceae bacterium]|nr:hypothetical protein [Lachnospiraceae bacterium]
MAQESVFGLHTGEFKHWISETEANYIKGFFGLAPNDELVDVSYFYQDGITKLWIKEVPNKQRMRYCLYMKINFSRVLKLSDHKIMPYTTANVKKAFKAINEVLKILHLSKRNNRFSEWTVERLDSAFDVYAERPATLMQLLNSSVYLDNKKKCKRIEIPGKTPEQLKYESMRFGNTLFVYNVYVKLAEVFAKANEKGVTITMDVLKEVRHILRVERQNHPEGIKKLLPNKVAGDLADAKVREGILKTMIDEMGIFFGKDDYSGADCMQGIYNRITAQYQQPRKYGDFPTPCTIWDGRRKATITLYDANSGRKQIQVAGKTLEDYEDKVFSKLSKAYMHNRAYLKSDDSGKRDMALKSADSIIRFRRVVKTAAVKQKIMKFIENFEIGKEIQP